MNLLLLAPDIQEALLFLPRTERGRDSIRLRQLQPLAALLDWLRATMSRDGYGGVQSSVAEEPWTSPFPSPVHDAPFLSLFAVVG